MSSLREIEAIVYNTDCKDNVSAGWSSSMPILTKDENGKLIDNYFAYAVDFEGETFSTPINIFGIYSDDEKTAYNKEIPESEVGSITIDEKDKISVEEENRAYDRFVELFPAVRECTYSDNCTDEQKAMVKEYVSCLEKFSGPVVWKYYLELFPSFFEWADSLG